MNWKMTRFKGGKKWVCWQMVAWVTYRKGQPLHIGFCKEPLGTWQCSVDEAKQKLERMYHEQLALN